MQIYEYKVCYTFDVKRKFYVHVNNYCYNLFNPSSLILFLRVVISETVVHVGLSICITWLMKIYMYVYTCDNPLTIIII